MIIRAALLALLLSAAPALAAYRITFDPGGSILGYIARYQAVQDAGGNIIIDGPCISACTLVTAIVDDARVCVTRHAILAFHSASTEQGQHHSEATRLIWHMYPERVRALVLAHGFDGDDAARNAHPELVYIEGAELRTLYQECAAPTV